MNERVKILGACTLLGFIAGVIAYFTYHRIIPVILTIFPELINAEWFLSGLAGAAGTLIIVTIWATISHPR
jgi:hypothetical protein